MSPEWKSNTDERAPAGVAGAPFATDEIGPIDAVVFSARVAIDETFRAPTPNRNSR
jgi:hypothetical protein